jgi:hypothetical protein
VIVSEPSETPSRSAEASGLFGPGSVIVFPKFIKGTVAVDGVIGP